MGAATIRSRRAGSRTGRREARGPAWVGRWTPRRRARGGCSGGSGDHALDRGDRTAPRPRVGPTALPRRSDSATFPGRRRRRHGISLEPARGPSRASAARSVVRGFSTSGAGIGSGLPQGIPRSDVPQPRAPPAIPPLGRLPLLHRRPAAADFYGFFTAIDACGEEGREAKSQRAGKGEEWPSEAC